MPDALGFVEVDRSPGGQYTREGGSFSAVYQGPWAYTLAFMQAILTEDNGLGRVFPHFLSAGARAIGCSFTPAEGAISSVDDTHCLYEHSLVTVEFKTPGRPDPEQDQQPETADLITEGIEPNAEFMTLDAAAFEWATADGGGSKALLASEAPGKIIRGLDYILTFHQLPNLPTCILTAPGCANNAPVHSRTLGWTFPAETLMYHSPSLSRKWTTTGVGAWSVANRFSYRPNGWNKFWRAKLAQWDTINIKGGGVYRNYPLIDFEPLLNMM